jgi:hypothetical protein
MFKVMSLMVTVPKTLSQKSRKNETKQNILFNSWEVYMIQVWKYSFPDLVIKLFLSAFMSLPIVTEMKKWIINKGNSRIGPPLWIVSYAILLALILVLKLYS